MMRAAFLVILLLAGPALAQPPASKPAGEVSDQQLQHNQPNHSEAELLQRLNESKLPDHNLTGFIHIPDTKAAVLEQPQGRLFQSWMTQWRRWVEGALIIVAVAAMAGLYLFAGVMTYRADPQGRTMQRFNQFERFIHWLTAFTFIVLAITGLNLVFGRVLLQPLIGDAAFYQLTVWGKLGHNFFGFSFIFGLVVMILQWLRENLPTKEDIAWIKSAGGMFGGAHPPAWKFNAGQKMIYWIAFWGGGLICLTGLALIFPFYVAGVNGMQVLQVTHSAVAAAMIAVVIGHVYLGWIGVKGSIEAMWKGRVDVNWAATHHPLWLEQEVAKGHAPRDALPPMHPAE